MQYIVESAARYQNKNLSAILYENSLLQQRNKTLADQNQKLILAMQDLQQSFKKNKENVQQYQNKIAYFQQSSLSVAAQISKIIKVLQYKIGQKQQIQFKLLHQMMKNGCHQSDVLQTLCELLQNLVVKQNQKLSEISRLSKLVQRRKQKLNVRQFKNKQIVHLIKQPAYIQTGIIQSDLQFIIRQSQKISQKIKRKQVKQQNINRVYNELLNFVELRKSIRINEKTLQKRERQIELNVGCRRVFEQLSNRLLTSQEQELKKKQQIEQMLANL